MKSSKFRLKSPRLRRSRIETLERRDLLAASLNPLDINQDDYVTAVDALQIINVLDTPDPPLAMDVNGDGFVTANDALQIINFLNATTVLPQSESDPSAVFSLPDAIRQRDVASLTLDEIVGVDASEISSLQIVWGDGRVTSVPNENLIFPLTRLHSYFASPGTFAMRLDAVLQNDAVMTIGSKNIEVLANSPSVIDRSNEGLTGVLYATNDFTGPSVATRTDPTIDFDFGIGSPDPKSTITTGPFSIRWQGFFTPQNSGDHSFFAALGTEDTANLYIDNQLVMSATGAGNNGLTNQASVNLIEGQPVAIEIEYAAGTGASRIQISSETASSFKTALPSHSLTPLVPISNLRGGVLAEQFASTSGSTLTDFRGSSSFIANTPTASFDLGPFAYASPGDLRASRIRGIVSPTVSGYHTFYLSGSGESELWLSQGVTSDTSRQIAVVESATSPQAFGDANAGVSDAIYLVAGQSYYIETLHVHNDPISPDHLAVGWTQPGQTGLPITPIPLAALRPIVPQVTIHADVSQTHEADVVSRNARFVIARNDDLGKPLDVAYTVGGTALNGVDYAALSGIATIPAGQRFVRVELDPVDDNILENAETTVVRLVADASYQLSSESQRAVTLTITGELQNEVQIIPQDFNNFDGGKFANLLTGNTITTISEPDATLPFSDGTLALNAYRVHVQNTTSAPWDTVLGYGFDGSMYPANTPFLASVWARSVNPDGTTTGAPTAQVGLRLQKSSGNYTGEEQDWQVNNEWTLLLLPVAPNFGGGTTNRTLEVRLGYQSQTVEIAGLSLIKLASESDFATAPKPIHTFGGRDFSANWREDAAIAAATNRNNPVQITIVDAAGNPIEGAVVTITPKQSSLPIGVAVSPELVVASNPLSQTLEAKRYQAILESFDKLTDGGTGQWGPWSLDKTVPQDFLDWVVERDIAYHGHALVWGEFADDPFDNFPTPVSLSTGYNTQLSTGGSAAAKAWLQNEILTHVTTTGPAADFTGARPNSTTPQVTWWDVINHPIFAPEIWDIVGQEFMVDVLQAARDTVDTDTELIINEFDILSNPNNGQSDDFYNLLTLLDSTALSTNSEAAAYDTIGFQGHFVSNRLPSIDRIMAELARYEAFDRDIQITEFDVDALDIDLQTQADFTRDFFDLLAANPNITAATLWGIWSEDHWRETPGNNEAAALFNTDWTPRPNGQWLLDERAVAESSSSSTTGNLGQIDLHSQSSSINVTVTTFSGVTFTDTIEIASRTTLAMVAPDYVVNSIVDPSPASILVDGVCDDGIGNCTLREAMLEANASIGREAIYFDIPGDGPHTLQLASALPTITDAVTIHGTTQSGYAGLPLIELDGSLAGSAASGLKVTSGGSTVSGLAINRFARHGIEIVGGSGNMIIGNFIGVDASGTVDLGNTLSGIYVSASVANTIGGTTFATRNLISGNDAYGVFIAGAASTNNVVQGNYIGTNRDGTGDIGNSLSGVMVSLAPGNTIGGTTSGAGNVISGNDQYGLHVYGTSATSNLVQANFIGTNADGSKDLGNAFSGVLINAAPSNIIGGTSPAARNIISGNDHHGVAVFGAATGNFVQGNYIGLDIGGTVDLGNTRSGVQVLVASGNTIGGTATGAGNVISNNAKFGVELSGVTTTGNIVQGNLIGTEASGTSESGNLLSGVIINGAVGNTIGGTIAGASNLISGNGQHGVFLAGVASTNNLVQGNYIGTNLDGTGEIGNSLSGVIVSLAPGNTIGGTTLNAGNVISGNNQYGLHVYGSSATSNLVQGNFIGTNADGSEDLGNAFSGVLINAAPGNIIGGTSPAARNIISGNDHHGVAVFGAATGNLVQGNYIGLDVGGTISLGNTRSGVQVLVASGNTIGGIATGAGNVISSNVRFGIELSGATTSNNIVQGNLIGTNFDGTEDRGNQLSGILIAAAHHNTLGGSAIGAGNVISGNDQHGVQLLGVGATNNLVQGNWIGTDAGGTSDLGNAFSGVAISSGHSNMLGGAAMGAGNVIAFNHQHGIVLAASVFSNPITRNSIYSNGFLGIDLNSDGVTANDVGDPDNGANRLQNNPVWIGPAIINSDSLSLSYLVDSLPANSIYDLRVDFFKSDGAGEGQTYLGSDTYSAADQGVGSKLVTLTGVGTLLTLGDGLLATATDANGNTSEFSAELILS